jgi:hypothetical protein
VIKGFTSELVRTSGGLLEPRIKTGAKLLQREEEVRVRADSRAGQGLDGIDQSFELQALEVPKQTEGRIANSWKKHGSIDVMSRNDVDDACNFSPLGMKRGPADSRQLAMAGFNLREQPPVLTIRGHVESKLEADQAERKRQGPKPR